MASALRTRSSNAPHATSKRCWLWTALLGALVAFGQANAVAAADDEKVWTHALSLIGEPAYGPDFEHFGWVNPDAPKGGQMRRAAIGGFDSLNPFAPKGEAADGLGLVYDTLLVNSLDEPSTEYPLVAEAVSHPADFSSVSFRLNPAARFHDGHPVTAEDIVFSLEALKEVNPFFKAYYANVVAAEANGDHEVTFRFDETGNRELPLIMGQLYVLPKHYWTEVDASGEPVRSIGESTLVPPLGSGPYRVGEVNSGVGGRIAFERVEDYWARDLPSMKGQWNFDRIVYQYFGDSRPALLAFQKGDLDVRRENSSLAWATQYDFDAVEQGRVKKEEIITEGVEPMQGFVFNLRRSQFQDERVRRAFELAFDFEFSNENLFYGQYQRTSSFFQGSELAADGVPTGLELSILEDVRGEVPHGVFAEPAPVPSVKGDRRALGRDLRQAARLLQEAGFRQQSGKLVGPDGNALTAEILLVSPLFERIVLPYVENLKRLGVEASARTVDSSQYQRRVRNFEFDLVVGTFPQSISPGNEQRDFWGSEAADRIGSRNIIGIKNPAIDKLIDRLILAKDRDELVAASRALDRVLRWNHYIVPQWHNPADWIASWDKFGRPDTPPRRTIGEMQVWWLDADKAAKLAEATQ